LVVIPFDGVKIGFVNREDMWDTPIDLFYENWGIRHFNDLFDGMGIEPTIDSFKKFDKELKARNKAAIERFETALDTKEYPKTWTKNFLETVMAAYSPSNTGFKVFTTKTMPHNKASEVWVGGKIMYISITMWDQLRQALK
jgi:hypothetical protein